jgi:hypothetical protein
MKNYDIYKQQIENIENSLRINIIKQFQFLNNQKLTYTYDGDKSLQIKNNLDLIYDTDLNLYKFKFGNFTKNLSEIDCNTLNDVFGELDNKIFNFIEKYLKNILAGIKELSFELLDYNILTDQGKNIIGIKFENDTIYVNIANNNFLLDQLKNYEFNIQINIYQATIDITNLLISNLLNLKK